jgi:hypothetical protein
MSSNPGALAAHLKFNRARLITIPITYKRRVRNRKLVDQDPNNAEWQRDPSLILERLAASLTADQDFAGALDKDLESLAIRKHLSARDESNAQWQNDLSWGYISVGDLLSAKRI